MLVHKANILKFSQGLFRAVGQGIAREYEGRVAFEERIIDAAAMQMVIRPEAFDVIVTTNLFGDILSDLVSGLVGGLGLAPGANIGSDTAIFEAVHGTAPDIAGKGIANPGALLLAACLMLEHVGDAARGERIRAAFEKTVREGKRVTRDLGGTASTSEFATPSSRTSPDAGAARRCTRQRCGRVAGPARLRPALRPSRGRRPHRPPSRCSSRSSATTSWRSVATSPQRARAGEFQRARAFLRDARRVSRVIVVPGNHDVAWWRSPLHAARQ